MKSSVSFDMRREDAIEIDGQPVKAGDMVKVLNNKEGSTERYLRGTFFFTALVTNDNGKQWIDVYGGKNATTRVGSGYKMRSFDLERIELIPERKRRARKG